MKHLAIGAAIGFITTASPGTLTFDAQPPGRIQHALIAPVPGAVTIEGWVFTPTLENVWVLPDTTEEDDKPWMYRSPWLGFTGNSPASFTVSRPGFKFDFHGFDSIGYQPGMGVVESSRGHRLEYMTLHDIATPYRMNWAGLDWIRFSYDFMGLGPNGFDNLQVEVSSVPEPPTWTLFALPGLGLLLFWRMGKDALDET